MEMMMLNAEAMFSMVDNLRTAAQTTHRTVRIQT